MNRLFSPASIYLLQTRAFSLYHAETFIIVINSSDLKDPYSNMVAGQATPSGVFDKDDEGKDQDLAGKKCCKLVVAIPDRLDCLREIVEFCIPGYSGPSKARSTEVKLMRGKISHAKIQNNFFAALCCSQLQFLKQTW